jgi:threonine aldolase
MHQPKTSLVCLENSHNLSGGKIVPLEFMKELYQTCTERGVPVHLDGARIFNASTATKISVERYASFADSIMFCLSKGLSAPVGSILAGPRNFIDRARRTRKQLGGGMRQAGVLAAPGIIALTKMTKRLIEDHRRARTIAEGISILPGIELDPREVETNMVYFTWRGKGLLLEEFVEKLRDSGILIIAMDETTARMVVHREIEDDDVEYSLEVFRSVLEN